MKAARRKAVLRTALWLTVGAALGYLAAGIPAHYRAVEPAVLDASGTGSVQAEDLAADFMEAARPGPAARLWLAVGERVPPRHHADRWEELQAGLRAPQLSGGSEPYVESFLDSLPEGAAPREGEGAFTAFLIPRERREALYGMLRFSRRESTQEILLGRELTGTTTFMPVFTPAGAPLEATILTAALLAQGGHLSAGLRSEWTAWTVTARQGDREALDELEAAYLDLLAWGRRLDFHSLAALTRTLEDTQSLNRATALLRAYPERLQSLWAALVLAGEGQAGELAAYLLRGEETARTEKARALQTALLYGQGALLALEERDGPLYRPPEGLRWLYESTAWLRSSPLLTLARQAPDSALLLKGLLLLGAGLSLSIALASFAGGFAHEGRRLGRAHRVHLLQHGTVAVFVAFTLLLWMEPALLDAGPQEEAPLRLDFVQANVLDSLRTQDLALIAMDRTTLLVVLVFLLLQVVVYVLGLLKLAQIRAADLPARTKLRLLDNEENLFDLGLYIGLGGTVLALIFLALNIVQASLLAAYSSTLFGIIFVALLKVFNLRPYRHLLVLQAEHAEVEAAKPPPPPAPAGEATEKPEAAS